MSASGRNLRPEGPAHDRCRDAQRRAEHPGDRAGPCPLRRRFIGMARSVGNLIGNCVATVVIANWEGDFDHEVARRVLDGEVEATPELA